VSGKSFNRIEVSPGAVELQGSSSSSSASQACVDSSRCHSCQQCCAIDSFYQSPNS
jgi:hypothetical protein